MMRVVINTNIIVYTYLGCVLEEILGAFKAGKFTLVISRSIADEYFSVLRRPKFQIEQNEFDDFVSLLVSKAEIVSPKETVTIIKDDISDNKFLEAALERKASCIVSGDNHLLEFNNYRDIPIMSAREFILRLSESK